MPYTVKPLLLACPLFHEFHEPNKTANLRGANINWRPKIGRNCYSISNCMVLIRQNRRGQNNFACWVATFLGSQIKGFYSNKGMVHVSYRGSHSFACHPHTNHICVCPPGCRASPPFGWYSLRLLLEGWPGWVDLGLLPGVKTIAPLWHAVSDVWLTQICPTVTFCWCFCGFPHRTKWWNC